MLRSRIGRHAKSRSSPSRAISWSRVTGSGSRWMGPWRRTPSTRFRIRGRARRSWRPARLGVPEMLSPDEIRALELLIDRRVSEALRSGVDVARVVDSVNADRTVNLRVGDSVVPAVSALTSYTPARWRHGVDAGPGWRAGRHRQDGRGDDHPSRVVVDGVQLGRPRGGWLVGRSSPANQGQDGALWCRRLVADPGTTAGGVARTGVLRTYRGGKVTQIGIAEQGDYGFPGCNSASPTTAGRGHAAVRQDAHRRGREVAPAERGRDLWAGAGGHLSGADRGDHPERDPDVPRWREVNPFVPQRDSDARA